MQQALLFSALAQGDTFMKHGYLLFATMLGSRTRKLILYGAFALPTGTLLFTQMFAQEVQPSGREMVDAFHSAFGEHHERAVHARGVIVTGTFTPAASAAGITMAPHLQQSVGTITIIGRFSNFTGFPDISDKDPNASPRGMAVRFILPDGTATDIVNHSFNGFPTSTSAEFADLLRAIGASGKDVSHPNPLEQFLEGHPVAKTFLTTQHPPPVSWATTPYFGVNTFRFINAEAKSCFVRYQFIPLADEAYLNAEQIAAAQPDYLSRELQARLARAPVRFRWQAQIASSSDDIRDPSRAWPADRRVVELGILSFTRIIPGEQESQNLQFQPGAVTEGIETADDMLDVRKQAYPISVSERESKK
jgi:catalase